MDTLNVLLMGFISVVLINNLVFTKFLGICPYSIWRLGWAWP